VDTQRRLEDLASEPSVNSALGAFGRPGVHPESSVLGECCLAQERILRYLIPELVGGDEETRTPDPLLAKEMLCQLSYVPVAGVEWWAFLDSNQRPLPYQGSALTS
jgi:hypothetical protein